MICPIKQTIVISYIKNEGFQWEITFDDNLLNCSKWMDKTGGKLDKSKDYYNCVHPPMITGTRIIEKCPPAPLHVCKLGPFNHIIKNLAKISPDAVAKFVDEIKVSREKYHGGEYEGNEISKCLNNIHVLEHIFDDELAQDFVPTPKIHIIMEYIADYCHEFGVSLGHCSDQTIEAVHQVVNQRFLNSKYYIKFTDSDKQGEKLFNGIMHVNSYNI